MIFVLVTCEEESDELGQGWARGGHCVGVLLCRAPFELI